MVSAITKGTPVAVSGHEGRKSVEILAAIRRSFETGERVSLPL
jgi:predicted dehydrogenase